MINMVLKGILKIVLLFKNYVSLLLSLIELNNFIYIIYDKLLCLIKGIFKIFIVFIN